MLNAVLVLYLIVGIISRYLWIIARHVDEETIRFDDMVTYVDSIIPPKTLLEVIKEECAHADEDREHGLSVEEIAEINSSADQTVYKVDSFKEIS